jgi:hypothetical protein
VVGNAGHLKLRKYGQFIDKHELVLRFNAQSLQGSVTLHPPLDLEVSAGWM